MPLTKLHDVHPGSMPNTFTGTEDGRILYLGEGAQIAVVDLTTTPPAAGPGLMPTASKSFQVGDFAVLPADLLLDPALCFMIDADHDGEEKNDCADLLFVAGGHMGLWAVSADPTPGNPNRALRIDDQQDLAQPLSKQDSLTLRDDPGVPGVNFGFDLASTQRIETAGTPFRVRIRPAGTHGPKALLVTDAMGGLRIYGEEGQ